MRTIGRMWHPKWLVVLAILVPALTLSAETPAMAQETPGYDPDSPAGVEYQLPLQRTRREATGQGADDRGGGGSKPAPLFGAGASASPGDTTRSRQGGSAPDDSSQSGGADAESNRAGGTDASGSGRADGGEDGSGASGRSKAEDGPGAPRAKETASKGEDEGPLQLGVAGGVLVVLAGGAIGLAVRRRARGGGAEG